LKSTAKVGRRYATKKRRLSSSNLGNDKADGRAADTAHALENRPMRYTAIILLLASLLTLTSCKLWTIRPIESKEKELAASSREFNADTYVDSIWESKVVPMVVEKNVDLSALLTALDADVEAAKKQYGSGDAGGATHFIVKGTGRVSRVNSSSQNGAIVISLPNYKGKTEVVLQIGPVFRGTSIRDAVGFIQFNQFVNQLQFADVGNKLNDRVVTSVVKDFDPATAPGKQVSFYGAFTLGDRGKVIITPVKLETGGQP
jgi:predicted lipoprotein